MAFAFSALACAGNNDTAASSFSASSANNFSVGDFVVVAIALDNLGTSDDETSQVTAVVHGTNTFSKAVEYTNGSPGANAGATVSIWYCTATAASGLNSFAVTLSGSTTNKCIVGGIFTRDTSKTVQVISGSKATGEAKSITSGTIPNGTAALLFRGLAIEDNENAIDTATASWNALTDSGAFTTGGGAAANMACGAEYLIMTGTGAGVTSNPGGTSSGDMASAIIAFEEVVAGQTLSPSLFTLTPTFFTATVSATNTLTPALFSNPMSFPVHTVFYDQFLTPDLFVASQTFFSPSVAAQLAPSLYTNTQTFFSPTVTTGVTLSPSLFSNPMSFPVHTVSATYSLTPSLFTNTQTFPVETVTSTYSLTPALFTNAPTFHAATVSASYILTPSLFTNSQTFPSATVLATYTLTAPLFTNISTFPSATIGTPPQDLLPGLFTNVNLFYNPLVVAHDPLRAKTEFDIGVPFILTKKSIFRNRIR